MRPLDSNTKTGVTPPKHTAKQRILREYAIKYNLRIFVETGTYRGDMVEAMRGCCDHIYSIELSETLYQDCLSRFRGIPGIELIHGDSGVELGTLIKQIRRPALFWLDGHYSGGITARGTKDTPIMQELAHILSAPDMGHVIIIDDARCFGTYEGYPAISELCQYIQSKRPNTQIDIQDDMIRILPAMNQSKAAKSSDKVQNSALETIDRPLNARTGSGDRIIQFTQLGQFGRFGNQIFQYVFARLYAEKTNSVLEIPEWIGTKIFKNIDHPKPSRKLPRLSTDEPPNGRVNVDLCGYFQKQHFVDQFDKEKILSWLQFKDGFIDRYRHLAYDVVAHLRRGDYASKYAHRFCIVSEKSYVDACRKFNLDTENLHWVSQETQTIDPELPEELRFLPDFFTLINAKHLLRANSSFSFWAGFFNKNKVYSPVVAEKVGLQDVQFSEGNAEPTASRTGIFHFSNTFGGNKETVSSAVKNYCIRPDYVSQQHPEFQNMADCSRKVVYQRFVYEIARKIAVNKQFKSIVDMGCGGARKLLELLPEFHTIGVDLEPTVNKLRTQFSNHQWLTPDEASAIKRVDMVISADVIEHVPDPDAFLESIINMNPKVILISTPDRDYLVDVLKQNSKLGPPQNKTHLREWTIPEFNAYISKFLFIHRHMKFHNVDQISQLVICSPKNLATHRCTFGLKSDFSDEKVEQIVPAKTTAPVAAPRVSVLMAVHNGRDFVRQAVKSIYRQTFQDFEFVIVDDASTDGTSEILQQTKDARTVIIRNEANLGLTKSLNLGLRHCRGDYIARMDADDLSLPERFAKQVDFLDRHRDIVVVGTPYYHIDARGNVTNHINVPADDRTIRQWLRQKSPFGHGTVMMRRTTLQDCGGYDEEYECSQDYDLWLRLSERYQLANLTEPLYCWRSTPQCITHSKSHIQRTCHDRAIRQAQARRAVGSSLLSSESTQEQAAPPPLVSVIVPTYNRPDSLKYAVASILNQRYSNIEIIIINDGGVDIGDQVARWNLKNNIVYLKHETNKGHGAARNTGLRAASGKYIAYLDDDDIFFPTHIEQLVTALEQSSYRAAHTLSVRSHQVKLESRYVEVKRTLPYATGATHDDLLVRNLIPTLCIMHEKACLEVAGFFDETLKTHEDWDLWIRISRYDDFLRIPQITAMVTWRDDGTTTTSQSQNEFRKTPAVIYAKYRDWVKDKPHVTARQAQRLRLLGAGQKQSGAMPEKPSPPTTAAVAAMTAAAGQKPLRIAIKTCTPSAQNCLWGDTWFALGLSRAFEASGHRPVVHFYDNWNSPDPDIDVAIHIKGKFEYRPKPHCLNLLWVISHPELHTADEINRYDAVLCASKPYFEYIRPKVAVPCFYLPQATDSTLFKPRDVPAVQDIDVLFVGANYYGDRRRRIIDDILATGKQYDLHIVGQGWKGWVDQRYIKAVYVPAQKMPELYARAKIVLNDHHITMRQWGFINDRTYNLAAIKAFQISDEVDGLAELGIVTYRSPEDLRDRLDHYLARPAERQWRAEIAHQRCRDFTFQRAAAEIIDIAERLSKPQTTGVRFAAAPTPSRCQISDNSSQSAAAKVSVILACRNEERYLAECLDSVLAQTLSDWELLVVDDGSTDRTREILKAYAARDSRIGLWFFDDCKGPYVRRNFAIGQSRAPYISIQDADDLIVPEKLATLYRQIAGDERLGVVGSANRKFLEIIPGIEYGDYVMRRLSHEEIMTDFLGTLHLCWQGAALIRRRLFETVGLYDENPWGSDAFWLAKAGMYGYLTGTVRYMNLPECLTLKRERDDSQTGQLTPLDPRSRRHRVEAHYRKLLFQIGNAYRQNPGIDVAAGLRACSVQDYIDSNAALFERCESAPVTEAIVQQMTARIRSAIECGWFVTALMNLNVLERMAPQIRRRWPEFDWLAALSLYAAGHDDQAADRIARLDRAGQSRNVLDCSIPGAAERKRRAMTFYRNLNKYPQPLDTGQIGQPVAAGR